MMINQNASAMDQKVLFNKEVFVNARTDFTQKEIYVKNADLNVRSVRISIIAKLVKIHLISR